MKEWDGIIVCCCWPQRRRFVFFRERRLFLERVLSLFGSLSLLLLRMAVGFCDPVYGTNFSENKGQEVVAAV